MNSVSAELRAAFRSDNLSKHFGLVSEPGFQRDDLILAWLPAPRSYPLLWTKTGSGAADFQRLPGNTSSYIDKSLTECLPLP